MMTSFNRKVLFTALLAAVLLGMLLLSSCGGPVQAYDNNNGAATLDLAKGGAMGAEASDKGGISVSGQGSIAVKPDVATITLGVETTDADAAKARKANNDAMDKALKAVRAFGIADDDITTTNFNIYPVYDDKGQKITGYRVSNTVSVRVKDLAKLGDVLTAATNAGANTSYGISFDVLDRTQAYNDALKQAMDKAKARAEIMATALGVKVGPVLTINESSSYSGPIYYADDQKRNLAIAAGEVPVSSGQMEVTASVSVVYEIIK